MPPTPSSTISSNGPGTGSSPSEPPQRSGRGMRPSRTTILTARIARPMDVLTTRTLRPHEAKSPCGSTHQKMLANENVGRFPPGTDRPSQPCGNPHFSTAVHAVDAAECCARVVRGVAGLDARDDAVEQVEDRGVQETEGGHNCQRDHTQDDRVLSHGLPSVTVFQAQSAQDVCPEENVLSSNIGNFEQKLKPRFPAHPASGSQRRTGVLRIAGRKLEGLPCQES